MVTETHQILGGLVSVYRRERSSYWQCAASVGGRQWRVSTKSDSIALAKDFAEDWYLELRGKARAGILNSGKTFQAAAEKFLDEYPVITHGQRSETWVAQYDQKLKAIILPFLGEKYLSEITAGTIQDYRIWRSKNCKTGKPPSRSTMHQEIVAIRQVLKTAQRHGWIDHVPDLSMPYKTAGKVAHRAWFSPEEYKKLYEATRERASKPLNNRWKEECENFHDYILFMVNTGLRPDEAAVLELRDVAVETDEATGERILVIEVRGKRGVGYCKSMPGAVLPFNRTVKRKQLAEKPNGIVFGKPQRELLNNILDELELKFDRDGQRRTAYSLRHTYICMRLMEGADIYQVAKNCRTSVEMIEKFYASHIKNTLDASAINVRKEKPKRAKKTKKPK
ncbi:MAG: phage integrase SAM-like domain-containing protein [Alphaproteobacteria bacterium]|nr:phage integrase SAM-like domain-containing protein [Alphaproteobacteria bacterium]